jgi:ADP-ribose pyrophosphatase YjhB (NUDIX family)
VLDLAYRMAYRCAYKLMRVYWRVAHPSTRGALVALWHEDRILLIQNSYVPYRSLPGGYVRAHETFAEAAARELREEIGISARPDQLRLAADVTHEWEGKHEQVQIFELAVERPPTIAVDRREVIDAGFYSPRQALEHRLFPPLRTLLEGKVAR